MSVRPVPDMIRISVTNQTTGVTRQGFGTALFLTAYATSLNRVETVTKSGFAATILAFGFNSTSSLYYAMQDYFSQTPSPNTAYIGRVNAERQDVTVGAYDVLTTYTITIKDAITPAGVNYNSIAAGSANAAATALAGFITAGAQNCTAVAVGPDVQIAAAPAGSTLLVTASVAGGVGTIGLPVTAANEAMDTALGYCLAELADWYGIITVGTLGRTLAQQKLVAAWAETNYRFYAAGSADVNIPDLTYANDLLGVISIGAYCKLQNYANISVIYNSDQDPAGTDAYHDAAWLGRVLPADPGAINWLYKNLSSVSAGTNISATWRTNMGNKGVTWYEGFGGRSSTQCGNQKAMNGYGDYPDITRTRHWLKIRMEEGIAALFLSVDKVPLTNKGIASIKAEIQEVLEQGVKQGALASYTIYVPDSAAVSTANKVARNLPSVAFTAVISGAINSVEVAGIVTV